MRSKGVTLVELMVAMVVLGLVMLTTLNIFLPALQGFRSANAAYEAQRNVQVSLARLSADLREGRSDWVNSQVDEWVAIPTPRNDDDDYQQSGGAPTWQGWVVYWLMHDPSGTMTLKRSVTYPNPFVAPTASTPYVPSPLPTDGTQVATGLTHLQVLIGGGTKPTAEILINTQSAYQGLTTFQGDRQIAMFY